MRIVHCISELGPGGSEGQLTSLAVALKRAGHDVRVVQTAPREQSYERYRARLKAEAIPFVQAGGGPADGFGPAFWSDPRLPQGLFPHLPPEIGAEVLDLMGEFLLARPDVVHTWSDQSNLAGGLAAYLSGVPRIVIGLRSVNPTRFIPLQAAWMRTWYQVLARSSRVRFAANSRAGALDYAAWLGLSPERIKVVYNGLDLAALAARPDDEAVAFRQEAGLPPDGRLLGGVLRWCPEKRPVDFLRVVKEVRQRIPTARAVLAGNGIDEAGARRAVRRLGLEGAVDLLGRRNDIARVMAACDAILLTSEWEGTPNVLLEAQALGVPVVAVNTGGVADALIPGQTGLLAGVGETDRLADHVVSLLDNRELRDRMGRRGREFVRERFSEDQFLTGHLSIYYS